VGKGKKSNSISSTDTMGEALLKVFDGNVDRVPFVTFVNHTKKEYSLDGLLNVPDTKDVNIRALKAIMEIGTTNTDKVSKDKVDRFNMWFFGVKKKELIHTMDAICSKMWFFGAATSEDTRFVLSQPENLHAGTYLVRWDNPTREFILHYVCRKRKDRIKNNLLKQNDKEEKNENLGQINVVTLSSLVTQKIKELRLKKAAVPRPVAYIGLGLETTKFYTSSGSTLYEMQPPVGQNMADLTSHASAAGPVNFIL